MSSRGDEVAELGSALLVCHRVRIEPGARLGESEYRCMACGHLFIEEEREFCDAPPVGSVLAAQKVKALHEAKEKVKKAKWKPGIPVFYISATTGEGLDSLKDSLKESIRLKKEMV